MVTYEDSASAPSLVTECYEQEIPIVSRVTIWESGINENEIYVLREGVVKLIAHCNGFRTLELLYPGAIFGGLIFLNIHDIKFVAVAASDVIVSKVHQGMIQKYLPNMSAYITNLKLTGGEAANFTLRSRLVRHLKKDLEMRPLTICGQPAVNKILFHEEWATLLGSRRESVSRIFSELEREGCIKLTEKHIVFLKANLK